LKTFDDDAEAEALAGLSIPRADDATLIAGLGLGPFLLL
jgi:hypothetical protein